METHECVLVRGGNEAVVVNLGVAGVERPGRVAWVDLAHWGDKREGGARPFSQCQLTTTASLWSDQAFQPSSTESAFQGPGHCTPAR